jgi:single-strand DNA-binding protein
MLPLGGPIGWRPILTTAELFYFCGHGVRLGQNAEAKTAQNNREYVVLNIATQESWKNDKVDYENRTEWHRVYTWRNFSKFSKTLEKGQLVTLEGILRYREVVDEAKGTTFKHRIAEVHAIGMKRLSKLRRPTILRTEPTASNRRRICRRTASGPSIA